MKEHYSATNVVLIQRQTEEYSDSIVLKVLTLFICNIFFVKWKKTSNTSIVLLSTVNDNPEKMFLCYAYQYLLIKILGWRNDVEV